MLLIKKDSYIIIAGLDLSKTHYSLVVRFLKNFEDEKTFYTIGTTSKGIIKKAKKDNIIRHEIPSWAWFKKNKTNSQDAYNMLLIETISEFINKDISYIYKMSKPPIQKYIAIEGYAMHATGQLLQIAEIAGVIKNIFYPDNWKIRIHDPLSVKLWATGKGNADKFEMVQKAKDDGINIPEYLFKKKEDPGADVADAYFLMKMLETELKIRSNPLEMNNATDEQKRVFNRVTKANPVNILDTQFIEKTE